MAQAKLTWDRIQRGLMLLADMPDPGKVLRERLTRLIKTRGEASLGVLVNLVRPIPVPTVGHTLAELVRDKTLKIELRANPRNHKETSIFSLA